MDSAGVVVQGVLEAEDERSCDLEACKDKGR
jgi:hypothetical protein